MLDGHCADPSLPLHLDQGRGSSKKESFSLRVGPALHPPERPSPRRADMAGHGHGSGDAGTGSCFGRVQFVSQFLPGFTGGGVEMLAKIALARDIAIEFACLGK